MRLYGIFLFASALCAQVPYERIVNADREPGSWLTYSRNYLGHRYSPLDQITPGNVAGLKVKWTYQLPDPRNEVSPIVADGVMYVTGPNTAAALDTRTGRPLWTWKRPIPSDYQSIGFGRVSTDFIASSATPGAMPGLNFTACSPRCEYPAGA